jgi:hypothetical protein
MLHGDISNSTGYGVAFNAAAMFEIHEHTFLGMGRPTLKVNQYAEQAFITLARMSCNRFLLVEKPQYWRPLEKWRDSPMNPLHEVTMMLPIFYPDHYGMFRAQYNNLAATLWVGPNGPSYEEVLETEPEDIGTGWSMLIDLAKQAEA